MEGKTLYTDEAAEYYIGFRTPKVLMSALQDRADQEGRSVSDVIRRILAEYLEMRVEDVRVTRGRRRSL